MEETVSSDSSDINFVCGDPQVDPRVGDEYQVEIPPMISETEHTKLLANPVASKVIIDASSHSFLMGLSIPIMWISNGDDVQGLEDDKVDINESLKSIKARKSRFCTKNKGQKPDILDVGLGKKKRSKSFNLEPKGNGRMKNYHPVPGTSSSSWKDVEVDSFLLGLYIFGKNFVLVKKFMESKDMGDMLVFYFGKFYKTEKYHRWSDSRKARRRKCVSGRKLFSGWRQQELLSRLIPGVSEETQKNRLLNVSKSFAEGNISLEKYVFTLKAIVGVTALVDAVAIGKGKEDLMSLAMEPVKTKQWFTVTSDQPVGKAYASLTSSDIIKQLTDGSRLSKARCNDIFWEAVWPRLLARGWHSEQPKSRGYVTSKDYLVFLVPGVKKFLRSKLVKGDHYFDSVSDILTKVASEPELLEFESREIKAASFNAEDSSDQDSPSDSQSRHHYLRSPVSKCSSLHMKFTVVDTSSLATGGKLCALRELKFAATDSHFASETSIHIKNGRSASRDSGEKRKLQKTCDIPLDGGKGIEGGDDSEEEIDFADPDNPRRFTVVDTSLEHGRKSSGLRKLRCLPINISPRINRSSTENDEVGEHVNSQAGACNNSEPDGGQRTSNTGVPCRVRLDSVTAGKMLEKQWNQQTAVSNDGRPKRVIKHKFTRRAETNHSGYNAPLLKRRRLSTCVKKELSRLNENSSVKPELNQTRPYSPPSTLDPKEIVHVQEGTHQAKIMSSKENLKEERNRAAVKDDSFDIKVNEGIKEKHQIQFPIDLNLTPNDPNDFENGQPLEMGTHVISVMNPADYCSMSDLNRTLDSKESKTTTHDVGSVEKRPDMINIPRRHSTRKRPLTTRVLESLEMGLFSKKKQKSTKPRKQESPLRNPATKARSTVGVISDRAGAVQGLVEAENGADTSFLVEKVKTNKPLDHIEDERLTKEPKRPPILLKLSLKRNR